MNEILADHALACRLERSQAAANARFVEARARVAPDSGAVWIEVGGTHAMFDGPDSASTQSFCLGLFQPAAAADLLTLETFFKERGAPVTHEICPLSGRRLLEQLNGRGYRPVELTNVMFLPLGSRARQAPSANGHFGVRVAGPHEGDLWARTAAEGWSGSSGASSMMFEGMQVASQAESQVLFLVEELEHAVAAGALAIHDGAALFAGACTIPAFRRRGAQNSLLEHRLRYAAEAGCDLAVLCAEPGSASQRNAERQGFRIAYTRIKWVQTPRRRLKPRTP